MIVQRAEDSMGPVMEDQAISLEAFIVDQRLPVISVLGGPLKCNQVNLESRVSRVSG